MTRTAIFFIAISAITVRSLPAGSVLELEQNATAVNNSPATAQVLSADDFTIDPNAQIFKAGDGGLQGTTITASITGRTGGGSTLDVDFYQFEMLIDGFAWFDIDGRRSTQFDPDATLHLFDGGGTLLAQADDSVFDMNGDTIFEADPGSFNDGNFTYDSFIGEMFLEAGTYYLAVAEFNNFATGGGNITATPQPTSFFSPVSFWARVNGAVVGDSSFSLGTGPQSGAVNYVLHISQAVPEPTAFLLWITGIVALAWRRTRTT